MSPHPEPVYLVACVAQKRAEASLAADLYVSGWFRKARAYVEARGGRWYILSAKYGLLAPDTVIDPYEQSLNTMPSDERRTWSSRVVGQLDEVVGANAKVIFLAGERYRSGLVAWAAGRYEVPMQGLAIGQQKAWLKANLRIEPFRTDQN